MGFLYKYDESKVRMQNVTKELFWQNPEKFSLVCTVSDKQNQKTSSIIFHFCRLPQCSE